VAAVGERSWCSSLTQQPAAKHQTAACSSLPFLPSGMGRRMDERENSLVEIKTV